MTNDDLADFDDYVDQYDDLLKKQLSFFEGDRSYFSEYKVKLLKSLLEKNPKTLLDFGAGIGLSLPHFLEHFPQTKICATDISKKSLGHISNHFPNVTVFEDEQLKEKSFDVIFLSGVVHHVPLNDRFSLLKRLKTLLAPNGVIIIFEHNPFNPVTRRMVATCPFDKGVTLISKRKLLQQMEKAGFKNLKGKFTLFFPEPLKTFRSLESKLEWCPLGGQYMAMGHA